MEDEIIALQAAVAHQQVEIIQLGDEIYAQQKEMLALRRELADLRNAYKNMQEEGGEGIRPLHEETPPPHY